MARLFTLILGDVVVLAALSGVAQAQITPSFDCSKASTEVEKTVCASPDLSKADAVMADAYHAMLARAPEESKPMFRSDQRGWIAHLNKVCQARYAPPKSSANYKLECIASALKEQAEFYTEDALTPLPANLGMLVARQTYRDFPVAPADQLDNVPRLRLEAHRFPQFLLSALQGVLVSEPPTVDANSTAFETVTGFKTSRYRNRLLTIEYTNYVYDGGAHGRYGSRFETIDLQTLKKLSKDDVFKQGTQWQDVLAAKADAQFKFEDKIKFLTYLPLKPSDLIKAVGEPERWGFDRSFRVYFGIYEVSTYAAGPQIAQIPYADLRDYLTPEFKAAIGLD